MTADDVRYWTTFREGQSVYDSMEDDWDEPPQCEEIEDAIAILKKANDFLRARPVRFEEGMKLVEEANDILCKVLP